MSHVQRYRLPDGAGPLDRATLAVWKIWDGWLRAAAGGSARNVMRFLVGVTAILVLLQTITMGPWAIVGGVALVGGAIVGWIMAGRGSVTSAKQPPQRTSIRITSLVLSLLLAFLVVPFALLTATVISAFLIVPVTNYGWPAALLLAASMAVGWLLRRRRILVNSRYP
ncbi:MAG: hypothetical protein ACC658_05840 [Acidimicrobiia bacterium]